ncbi:MAG: hypothetical protein CW338_11525 [Clostridiales bacterium]|nr:hypothetical protein [Clostridiales bacterium]
MKKFTVNIALVLVFAFILGLSTFASAESEAPAVVIEPPVYKFMYSGETYTVPASVLPAGSDQSLIFTSSDMDVAKVNRTTGEITAYWKAGKSVITATSAADPTLSAEFSVYVYGVELDKYQTELRVGDYENLVYGVTTTGCREVEFWSDNEDIATVSDRGFLTGTGYGATWIHARIADGTGVEARCWVVVDPAPIGQILINKDNTIAENAPVSAASLNLGYGDLNKGSEIFSEKELSLREEKFDFCAFVTVDEAAAPDAAAEAAMKEKLADKDVLGFVAVNVQPMKRADEKEPEAIVTEAPLSVTLTLKPDQIPEGAAGAYAFVAGAEEPIECEFNAETGDVTFESNVFGDVVFGFV